MGPFKFCFVSAAFASFVFLAVAIEGESGFSENPRSQPVGGAKNTTVPPPPKEVYTLERFYRTYGDGTIEYKLVLSNGVAEFQKITNKEVDGKKIQVYEGYYSSPQLDGNYSRINYIADEKGYRIIKPANGTIPLVLTPDVPKVPKIEDQVQD